MCTTSYLPAHSDAIYYNRVAWSQRSGAGIEFAFNSRSMMGRRERLWRAERPDRGAAALNTRQVTGPDQGRALPVGD
ncbi:MAG: hypothetical protein K0Q83_2494 [Deltaproteobacteria bacterium]|jgi:hypothetical protein|nr:hypothetical protein [Deltaproteobacteria bacterium]